MLPITQGHVPADHHPEIRIRTKVIKEGDGENATNLFFINLTQLSSLNQRRFHKLRQLSLVEEWGRLLNIQLNLFSKVIRVIVEHVKFVQRSLELRILSQPLQLGIQRSDTRFVTLKTSKSHVDHAVFKVSDLDATRVVLKVDLILNTANVVISESSM